MRLIRSQITDLDITILVDRAEFAALFSASLKTYSRNQFRFGENRKYYCFITGIAIMSYFKNITTLPEFNVFLDSQIEMQSREGLAKIWYCKLMPEFRTMDPAAATLLFHSSNATLWQGQPYKLKPEDQRRNQVGKGKWSWALPVRIQFKEEGRNLKRAMGHLSELIKAWRHHDHREMLANRATWVCRSYDESMQLKQESKINTLRSEGPNQITQIPPPTGKEKGSTKGKGRPPGPGDITQDGKGKGNSLNMPQDAFLKRFLSEGAANMQTNSKGKWSKGYGKGSVAHLTRVVRPRPHLPAEGFEASSNLPAQITAPPPDGWSTTNPMPEKPRVSLGQQLSNHQPAELTPFPTPEGVNELMLHNRANAPGLMQPTTNAGYQHTNTPVTYATTIHDHRETRQQ